MNFGHVPCKQKPIPSSSVWSGSGPVPCKHNLKKNCFVRVSQGFGVYGIQGSYKLGIPYRHDEIWVFGISLVLVTTNFGYKVFYIPFNLTEVYLGVNRYMLTPLADPVLLLGLPVKIHLISAS